MRGPGRIPPPPHWKHRQQGFRAPSDWLSERQPGRSAAETRSGIPAGAGYRQKKTALSGLYKGRTKRVGTREPERQRLGQGTSYLMNARLPAGMATGQGRHPQLTWVLALRVVPGLSGSLIGELWECLGWPVGRCSVSERFKPKRPFCQVIILFGRARGPPGAFCGHLRNPSGSSPARPPVSGRSSPGPPDSLTSPAQAATAMAGWRPSAEFHGEGAGKLAVPLPAPVTGAG
jgi:hypothetical protein